MTRWPRPPVIVSIMSIVSGRARRPRSQKNARGYRVLQVALSTQPHYNALAVGGEHVLAGIDNPLIALPF